MIGGRDGKHASIGIFLLIKLCLFVFFDFRNQASQTFKKMTHSVSELFYFYWFVLLHVCFGISFVGEKVFYCNVIFFFEKSSNLVSSQLLSTNVCLWKSTQTVLYSKYRFCSKNANQTGNTSSLLVHCPKQYPAISYSNG